MLTIVYGAAWLLGSQSHARQPDMAGYYAYAQSLLLDGDLAIAPELLRWGLTPSFRQLTVLGHANDFFAVGTALLWLPFVAGAHAVALLGKATGAWLRADGYGPVYVYALNLGSAVYGYLAVVLAHETARRFVPERVALAATLAVLVLSPLGHYCLVDGSLSHAADACVVAALFYLCVRPDWTAPRPARDWVIAGAVAGLCTLVRWQNLVLPAAIGLLLLARAGLRRDERRQRVRTLAAFTGAAVLAFMPQLIVWWLQFGTPVAVPHDDEFFRHEPLLYELLLSSHHGLFTWTPLLLLSVGFGLPLLARRSRGLTLVLAACLVIEIYVNASVKDPWGGASFGARRFVGLSALFVLGLAAFYERAPRRLSAALTALCALWTIPLWLAYGLGALDPTLIADWPVVLDGMRRGLFLLPKLAERPLLQVAIAHGAGWLALVAVPLVIAAWSAAFALAFRRELARRTLVPACLGAALLLDGAVAVAALRSEPAPVRTTFVGDNALIDFGWYTNARFDRDPFLPILENPAGFAALSWGRHLWHGVPFQIRRPIGGSYADPSIASTCRLPEPVLSMPLEPAPIRALHFALTAYIGAEPDGAVATVRLEHPDGSRTEHALRAGRDVWHVMTAVPPDRRVASGGVAYVQGLTLPIGKPVSHLTLRSSSTRRDVCITAFAITREGPAHAFEPIDLEPIANADYMVDPFGTWFVLNHFPSLRPGVMEAGGILFRLLDHRLAKGGGSTIATAYRPYRQRIPLARRRSSALAMLLDGGLLPDREIPIAHVRVQYDRGPDSRFELRSQRDVTNYYAPAAPPVGYSGPVPQDLTLKRWPLDPTRTPRFLWIEGVRSGGLWQPGVAVFAITQVLAKAQ